MAVGLLNSHAPVSTRVRQEVPIVRAAARGTAAAPTATLARLAYIFVRHHIESVVALTRVLRGQHRSTTNREEERW
jgi:hypothetical protein